MNRAKQSSTKGSNDLVRALRRLGVTATASARGLEVSVGDGAIVWCGRQCAPQWVSLARPIDADPGLLVRLGANLHDLDGPGWCVAGDAAAAAWHAPTVGGDVGVSQWYVPTLDVLDTATTVAEAPWDIPALTQAFLRRVFLENADVTAGRIDRWMGLPAPVAPGDLRRVATRCLNQVG